jgi:MinD superfamily P-loop ATPase
MVISIASGKGGTGKTTFATSLALSIENTQLLVCDVEEPNAHIFLKLERCASEVVSIPVPEIDDARCDYCGECAEVCAYNALAVLKDRVLVFPHLCHGCGGCTLLCPRHAIAEAGKPIGVVECGRSGGLDFCQGILNVGEIMAPPLVRAVKKKIDPAKTVIIDAPPGTSCPVIAAVQGSDYCVLVTEPTPFGLNDLILAVEVVRKLKIPFGVVVNRADPGDRTIEQYCDRERIPVLMRIPFDREIAVAYSKGIALAHAQPKYIDSFKEVLEIIEETAHES